MAKKEAKLSTVKKWEANLKCELEYDVVGTKVIRLRCLTCKRWENRINSMKNFSETWIRPGTMMVEKDSVVKHLKTTPHEEAMNLTTRSRLGAEAYTRKVVDETPIGRGIKKMCSGDKKALELKFNTAYYLAKKERPYSDFPDLLQLQNKNGVENIGKAYLNDRACADFTDYIAEVTKESLNRDIAKAHYYTCLSDGSTDSAVLEQEVIYILFLNDGVPMVKYLSIEAVKSANAAGIIDSFNEAFSRFGIKSFTDKLIGINVDGASVNTGIHHGVGAQLKEISPWLQVIHCFNHRVELALKDAFETTAFNNIEEMLCKLYYLYQKSPKRLRELQQLSEAYEKSLPKPKKCNGTRWIDHKFKAMETVFENYGIFMTHLESLANTDSQSFKRAELEGFAKKWKCASYVINISIYLDVLSPIRRLAVALQQDQHNPVKAVRRIQEFSWTMAKLKLLIDESLDSDNGKMTHYKQLISKVEVKEDGKHYYQDTKLSSYNKCIRAVHNHYTTAIINVSDCMQSRFSDLSSSPVFKNMVSLLDVSTWPLDGSTSFGDREINEIVDHFNDVLTRNGCDVSKIPEEWEILKTYILPVRSNNSKLSYLEVWKNVFQQEETVKDCGNILQIFEILLITPFTNAKLERMFSRMARVKSDWRNRLGRKRLDGLLRIGEEGPTINEFNPLPSIDLWFNDKVRRLTSSSHNYPEKRRKLKENEFVDIATLTMSDLEDEDDDVFTDHFL